MEYILQTNNLRKQYGNFNALDGLTLHIKKGDIYGLVGRNGSGKTTFMRVVTGLQSPTSGSYTLCGAEYGGDDINKMRSHIGAIIETPALYGSLTAKENLVEQNIICGNPDAEQIDEILKCVGLYEHKDKKVKNMSLGMRQKLAIALALVGNPDLLFLDEPINGLDPRGIIEIRELILELNEKRGITVLVSSYILGELSKLATCYGFIENGKVVQEISAQELLDRCKKKTVITVDDTAKLPLAFEEHNIEYAVVSETTVEIYSEISISKLTNMLSTVGVEIIKSEFVEEDLETYFMNLIGGEKND